MRTSDYLGVKSARTSAFSFEHSPAKTRVQNTQNGDFKAFKGEKKNFDYLKALTFFIRIFQSSFIFFFHECECMVWFWPTEEKVKSCVSWVGHGKTYNNVINYSFHLIFY